MLQHHDGSPTAMQLEQLQPNAVIHGILPDALVTVVSVQWFGSEALELTYKTPDGKVANEILYRDAEPRLELAELGRPWSFDGDGCCLSHYSPGAFSNYLAAKCGRFPALVTPVDQCWEME